MTGIGDARGEGGSTGDRRRSGRWRSGRRWSGRRWSVGDQGSASVVAVVVAAIWFGLVVVGVRVGEVVVTRHRLGAAADLGALAAAGWLSAGVTPACGRAEWVVERMGGRLTACRVDGWEVEVTVSGEPAVFGAPSARARAGPAEP